MRDPTTTRRGVFWDFSSYWPNVRVSRWRNPLSTVAGHAAASHQMLSAAAAVNCPSVIRCCQCLSSWWLSRNYGLPMMHPFQTQEVQCGGQSLATLWRGQRTGGSEIAGKLVSWMGLSTLVWLTPVHHLLGSMACLNGFIDCYKTDPYLMKMTLLAGGHGLDAKSHSQGYMLPRS